MTIERNPNPNSIDESVDTMKITPQKKIQETINKSTSDKNINRVLVFAFGVLTGMAIVNTMHARRPIMINMLPTSQIPATMLDNHRIIFRS